MKHEHDQNWEAFWRLARKKGCMRVCFGKCSKGERDWSLLGREATVGWFNWIKICAIAEEIRTILCCHLE